MRWLAGTAIAAAALLAGASAVPAAPAPAGKRLGFVVTSFYYAMYQGKDACPTGMQHVATSQEYLAKLPQAERDRLLLPENKRELFRRMVERGPKGENMCEAPWKSADPTLATLAGDRNDGLDLDGWAGTGKPPAGVCPQKQYIGEAGEGGIDNQLGRVVACLNGYREKGTLTPYFTQAMRNGMWSMLIDVSGVDDTTNDPDVVVDVYAGQDTMAKDAGGKVLTGASLAPLPDPKFHRRLKGRIKGGVLETVIADDILIPDVMSRTQPPMLITSPRFRLTLLPDGTAKGFLGGYRDLDGIFKPGKGDGESELYMGMTCDGLYHALHRFADGQRDPRSGTCNGISLAFRIEAIPAFIVHPDKVAPRSFADAK